MGGRSDQTDGYNDMQSGGAVSATEVDMARFAGHIDNPKCYPSWVPELAGRSNPIGDNQISKDAPLLRELEGKSMACGDKCLNGRKRSRQEVMVDESRQFNPRLHGHEVPLIIEGRPEIEDSTISANFPVRASRFFDDRMEFIARNYPDWPVTLRRLALGAFVMSYTRRVDVVSMVYLLHLASGNTVLKLRIGSLSVYEGGFYEPIGDMAPEYILTHCALFAQTLEGLLWEMGRIGDSSRRESDIYIAVGEVYRRETSTARQGKMRRLSKATHPDPTPEFRLDAPVPDHEIFATLREKAAASKVVDLGGCSWQAAASVMCWKIDDTLHLTMVSGSIFPTTLSI